MGMGVAGMILTSDSGSFPHSLRLAPEDVVAMNSSGNSSHPPIWQSTEPTVNGLD